MDDTKVISGAISIGIVIIGWFIKNLINGVIQEVKDLELKVNSNIIKIEVLSSNHLNLDKKIDNIFEEIKGLRNDIKEKK